MVVPMVTRTCTTATGLTSVVLYCLTMAVLEHSAASDEQPDSAAVCIGAPSDALAAHSGKDSVDPSSSGEGVQAALQRALHIYGVGTRVWTWVGDECRGLLIAGYDG